MKSYNKYIIFPVAVIVFFTSCSTLDKTSTHGFNSGYYKLQSKQKNVQNVYLDVTDEKIDVYHETEKQPDKNKFLTIALKPSDSLVISPMVFSKKSLDIDITAILLKYRPAVYGLPGQLNTDFNVALYAGWRHDNYTIKKAKWILWARVIIISRTGDMILVFLLAPGAPKSVRLPRRIKGPMNTVD